MAAPITIGTRDFDYIEGRLLAPCGQASEAYERLLACGQGDLAEELMKSMQSFTDVCRAVRKVAAARHVRR